MTVFKWSCQWTEQSNKPRNFLEPAEEGDEDIWLNEGTYVQFSALCRLVYSTVLRCVRFEVHLTHLGTVVHLLQTSYRILYTVKFRIENSQLLVVGFLSIILSKKLSINQEFNYMEDVHYLHTIFQFSLIWFWYGWRWIFVWYQFRAISYPRKQMTKGHRMLISTHTWLIPMSMWWIICIMVTQDWHQHLCHIHPIL